MDLFLTSGLFIADQGFGHGLEFHDAFDDAMMYQTATKDSMKLDDWFDAQRAYCAC